MTAETQIEQLARITGVPLAVVAAVFADPVPGQLRPAEIESARRRVEVGEAAEQELAYRAMVNDCGPPGLYTDDDLDAA